MRYTVAIEILAPPGLNLTELASNVQRALEDRNFDTGVAYAIGHHD